MISAQAAFKLYEAALIRRWSDYVTPIELDELSRQSHVAAAAFVIASEDRTFADAEWQALVELILIRYLRRLALSDIQAPVFNRIYQGETRRRIDSFVLDEIGWLAEEMGPVFAERAGEYYLREHDEEPRRYACSARVLDAAGVLVNQWEFNLFAPLNTQHRHLVRARADLSAQSLEFADMPGVRHLTVDPGFLQVYGQLRSQNRWTRLHTAPEFSVAAHCFVVATLSFCWMMANGISGRRVANAFFGGVFHDLAESLTKDVSSPVKTGSGLSDLLTRIEHELLEEEIWPLLPERSASGLRHFVVDEFADKVFRDGRSICVGACDLDAPGDVLPYDGRMLNACDKLSASIEAAFSISNGAGSDELKRVLGYNAGRFSDDGAAFGLAGLFATLAE